jgi:hypothetical protein
MAAEAKTKENNASVKKFLDTVEDKQVRKDCYAISDLLKSITKCEPKMWGTAIVGFGSYHYKYDSGHEGDSCILGFSPRKQNITLYVWGPYKQLEEWMPKLGKFKTSKGCLYIKSLADVDEKILKKIITFTYSEKKKRIAADKKKAAK